MTDEKREGMSLVDIIERLRPGERYELKNDAGEVVAVLGRPMSEHDEIDQLRDEIDDLRKQRDDLQAANTAEVERRRKAEAALEKREAQIRAYMNLTQKDIEAGSRITKETFGKVFE